MSAIAQVQQPDDLFKQTHDNISAADPFDVGTGIYYREYEDLSVKDTIPIDFVRTQRNMDPQSRSFGIGGSTSYDMFIVGDVNKFSWVALVLTQNNEEVKVVQELLRHANSRITLDLYAQAGMPNKRLAQSKLVRMVLNKGKALA